MIDKEEESLSSAPRGAASQKMSRRPLILFAHRGAPRLFPENTLASFEAAWALGADVLEMDVRQTRDGALVVFHDASLQRMAGKSYQVSELPLEALQKIPLRGPSPGKRGEVTDEFLRIPSLAEVLEQFEGFPLNIDLKKVDPIRVSGLCERISAAAKKRNGGWDVTLTSAQSHLQKALERASWPASKRGMGKKMVASLMIRAKLGLKFDRDVGQRVCQIPLKSSCLGFSWEVLTPSFLARLKAARCPVHVWPGVSESMVDDPVWAQKLYEKGVDGVFTDDIATMAQAFNRKGRRRALKR